MYNLKEIKLEVTNTCPLNCIHCSTDAGIEKHVQISWSNAQRILGGASSLGVKEISFSGGEPLYWPELEKAITLAHSYGIQTTIYTTGVHANVEKLFTSFRKEGLNKTIFSLYSNNAKEHDAITNVSGSFDKTISAIDLASKLGFETSIHFVPTTINYKRLEAVYELSCSKGANQVSVLRLVPQGRGATNQHLILNKKETIALKHIVQKLKDSKKNIRIGSPYNILTVNGNPNCAAGIDRLTIAPDLSIYPCDAFKQISDEMILGSRDIFSSLQTSSLHDCWEKSKYLHAIREYLAAPACNECLDCKQYSKCLSGCAAQKFYKHHTLLQAKDPLCLSR